MHKVIYTRTARRSLRRIAKDRVATIIGSINELASLEDQWGHGVMGSEDGVRQRNESFVRLCPLISPTILGVIDPLITPRQPLRAPHPKSKFLAVNLD